MKVKRFYKHKDFLKFIEYLTYIKKVKFYISVEFDELFREYIGVIY